jgi:hypothetical protein
MVIAFDGTHNARRAVRYAGRFLTADRAVVLTVWSPAQRGPEPVSVDLEGPPDPADTHDVDMAFADAQRINAEGLRWPAPRDWPPSRYVWRRRAPCGPPSSTPRTRWAPT